MRRQSHTLAFPGRDFSPLCVFRFLPLRGCLAFFIRGLRLALYGVAPLNRLCLRVATFRARQIAFLLVQLLPNLREAAGPFVKASINMMVRRNL